MAPGTTSTWLLLSVALTAYGAGPRRAAWSDKTHGPDGPWHALRVTFGSDKQAMDVYPGGAWGSYFLSPQICKLPESFSSACVGNGRGGGLYNANTSTTAHTLSPEATLVDRSLYEEIYGDAHLVYDTLTLPGDGGDPDVQVARLETWLITAAYRSLPNGTRYGNELGVLSLGGLVAQESKPDVVGSANVSLVAGTLQQNKVTSSSSFGMHIGSVAMGIPGSLYFGGYDQSRIVGTPHMMSEGTANLWADVVDIGIGVASGNSPFPFTSKRGLLANAGDSSLPRNALRLVVEPWEPYMILPQKACDAIAANLPVKYDRNLGFYFWNTTDEDYERIISSPSYLSFTFAGNPHDPVSKGDDFVIKVPFSLLSLTLTPPLVDVPTQYLPCRAPVNTVKNEPRLGRAFLQAAFIGVSYGGSNGPWFMAQAPGPNFSPPAVEEVLSSALFSNNSATTWEDTWKGNWFEISPSPTTPGLNKTNNGMTTTSSGIPVVGTNTGTNTPPTATPEHPEAKGPPPADPSSEGHLTTGAKAGVAVGAALAAVGAIAAAAILFWRRRRHTLAAPGGLEMELKSAGGGSGFATNDDLLPPELWAGSRPAELPQYREPVEMHVHGQFV
ncbi:hypothetical protein B0H63DRAFT_457721 [Podospora didyma]|uniref:Peptidase A1 domain-containing protein n=1 Tax=Podospora didyma TaxID=330526 RepID=A0AAE0P4K7_9PEZI|nr:hypothetical protein B0H63DRAFT_457721 [Podospora didyma]